MGNYLNITQVVFIIFQDGVMVTSGKGKNMKKINFILVTLVVIFNIGTCYLVDNLLGYHVPTKE